jgi:hypothetical protein
MSQRSSRQAAGGGALRTDCLAERDGGRAAHRVRHLADEGLTHGRPETMPRFEAWPRTRWTTARGASYSCSASEEGQLEKVAHLPFTAS